MTAIGERLLVIDDDEGACRLVKVVLSADGLTVHTVGDGQAGLDYAVSHPLDLVLLDLNMPGLDGFTVLKRLRELVPGVPVVMLSASSELKDAVQAMRLGAFDYITKPMDREQVGLVVRRALRTRALENEVQDLRHRLEQQSGSILASQMGPSLAIRQVIEQAAVVARSDFTVLVSGETGTGKELVAQAIHQLSDRRQRPLIALDCGAIPETLLESEWFGHEKGAFTGAERRKEGRFRLAERGTCFLDEVGNLPMTLQAKLLRVLESKNVHALGAEQSRPLDVRFIAAANQDLRERVAQGLFRADLYFRLAQYTIELPTLRARLDDIPFLAQRFIEEASIDLRRPIQTIRPDALARLRQHDWPGNVRELRNVIRQAVLNTAGLTIGLDAVHGALNRIVAAPPAPTIDAGRADRSLKQITDDASDAAARLAIGDALVASSGNKSEAARTLHTDYKTLHLKMQRLGIRAHP